MDRIPANKEQVLKTRILTEADVTPYLALRLQGLQESPTSFWAEHDEEAAAGTELALGRLRQAPGQAIFGAFDGDRLVGIAGVVRERMPKIAHRAFIWGVYVDPAWRTRGIGAALTESAIGYAKEMNGVLQVTLAVNTLNGAARALYQKTGFKCYGVLPASLQYDGVFYDEELMVLHLQREEDNAA
jgi:ribosomal protein S18 acetylase RimI-like enzyme